jgi:imidazolonepropionase-like amidohydrolase
VSGAPLHVRGTRVPDGAAVEWWVDPEGRLSADPVAGAQDVPGGWVVEHGLVDSHVHLTFEPHDQFGLRPSQALIDAGLRAHRDAGELCVRDAGSLPEFAPADLVATRAGVTVRGCGPFLAPEGGFMPRLHAPVPPGDAAETAAAQIRAGWPWAKVILDFPRQSGNPLNAQLGYEPPVLTEIAAAVHEAGGRLAVHIMADHADLAIEAGADTIEHAIFVDEDAVREMAARGTAWTPTLLTVAERYLEPVAVDAPPVRRLLDGLHTTLPLAAELGVRILAGTDEDPHGSVAREVAALIRYGLPARAAVAAATANGHELLGIEPVREGDAAALVTFDADPVDDPTVLARPAGIVTG